VVGIEIGYARVSTSGQDLTAQRDALGALGVDAERVYIDHGLTGTNRDRPGLREALAACRAGDTLVVSKLDRLARSLPDARDIADELTRREVKLSLGGSVHDPTDPVGRLLFNVLAMVAEFESDLIRMRTREGLAVAKAKGRLRGRQPKLSPRQEAHLVELYRGGDKSPAELAELFGVGRSTVYRAIQRALPPQPGEKADAAGTGSTSCSTIHASTSSTTRTSTPPCTDPAAATIARLTGGNFRLIQRLFAQIAAACSPSTTSASMTADVVEAASSTLVLGAT